MHSITSYTRRITLVYLEPIDKVNTAYFTTFIATSAGLALTQITFTLH